MKEALEELERGKFVLIHDAESRENETDMVIAAEHTKPQDIARMRNDGGGLICTAIDKEAAEKLGLPYLSQILDDASKKYPLLKSMRAGNFKYDKRSAFSVSINHRDTYTGISDNDRALTISELGGFLRDNPKPCEKEFSRMFRTEGHVPLLISSGLAERSGHTELSTAIVKMAGLAPAAAICEMLDSKNHRSLAAKEARAYAEKYGMIFLEAKDIKEKWQG
ncbi:MAG: 3,4-dihydroxy-2-butanone-4-phosphate synthase [Candidatus Altiarchaeota archaeon]|nr:3,4-dihydroxy-2-butanone-4-phosphate synthase [Candidatus Altiarchaeota archaeon]